MLTLEQVRAVNDGLARGDLSAALLPLEEQIDLRHAELPKIEKTAILAIQNGLSKPENAKFWASAVFAPNVSVRRFVRRTLLNLKNQAQSVAAPLQARLEEFWATETPLPYSNSAREAAARREQIEIVQSALEILLRADPERFLSFWADLIEAARPAKARQQQENEVWQTCQRAYSEAFARATEELVKAQLGEEFVNSQLRYQLPSRVWREIHEEAQNRPDVQKLLAELGENPWASAAQNWQPEHLFASALYPYISQNASGPQREVANRVRAQMLAWLKEVFDFQVAAWPTKEQENLGARLAAMANAQTLDAATIWTHVLGWLEGARLTLLPQLEANFAAHPHGYGWRGEDLPGLWMILAERLIHSLHRPYNSEEKDWEIPADITPQRLRALKIGKSDGRWSFEQRLEEVAAQLEKSPPQTPQIESETPEIDDELAEMLELDDIGFEPGVQLGAIHLGYSPNEWHLAQTEAEKSGESQQKVIEGWRQKIRSEIEAIQTLQQRAEKLCVPPIYIDTPVPRHSLWQVWQQKTPDLKAQLWPLVGEKLWALYDQKLESYRRIETDEIAPKLGEKLTPRELKEWKTLQRGLKRSQIQQEIGDIAALLRLNEGFDADLKMLELLKRPGVRDLLKNQQMQLLNQAAHTYFNYDLNSRAQGQNPTWLRENWFLNAQKWAPLLDELETALLDAKRLTDWEKSTIQQHLAIANYKLQTPQSRARFLEMAPQIEGLAAQIAVPVTALGDLETWLLLVANLNWPNPQLRELWTQTRQNSPEKSAKLSAQILEMLSTTTRERAAKFQIELAKDLSPIELEKSADLIVLALESSLISVKRWALTALLKIQHYDSANAAQLAGEMLWNENGALVKDAIKFLGAQTQYETAIVAFESLQDALTLENQPILELVLRALSGLKTKNPSLELNESAHERIAQLVELAPARFEKLGKKLV